MTSISIWAHHSNYFRLVFHEFIFRLYKIYYKYHFFKLFSYCMLTWAKNKLKSEMKRWLQMMDVSAINCLLWHLKYFLVWKAYLQQSIPKGSFFWDLESGHVSLSCFPPKTKLLIGKTAWSANQKPGCLLGKSLNSCSDSDLRKNWL